MLINNLFNFSEKQTTSSNTLEATVNCDQSNRLQISTNWHVKDQQDCSRFKNIPEIIQTGITTIIININNNILLLSKLCELNLKNSCCGKHEDSLPYLMMQYVHIRFHTESKRYRNIHLSKDRTEMQQNKKLSRTPKYDKNKPPK